MPNEIERFWHFYVEFKKHGFKVQSLLSLKWITKSVYLGVNLSNSWALRLLKEALPNAFFYCIDVRLFTITDWRRVPTRFAILNGISLIFQR